MWTFIVLNLQCLTENPSTFLIRVTPLTLLGHNHKDARGIPEVERHMQEVL